MGKLNFSPIKMSIKYYRYDDRNNMCCLAGCALQQYPQLGSHLFKESKLLQPD
jgi:hypothetical protein